MPSRGEIKIGLGWVIILCFLVFIAHFADFDIKGVKADNVDTQVEVVNATCSIGTVVFHFSGDITVPEWGPGAGTTTATTTFTVTDGNGWADIATTTVRIYRGGVTGEHTCASSSINCYHNQNWTSDDVGSGCQRISTTSNTATFQCTTTLWFFADPTDPGSSYADQWWEAYASSSDRSWANCNATNSGVFVDVATNRAIRVDPASITYQNLGAGADTGDVWVTTTATSTGNTGCDIHFEGADMTGAGADIESTQQHFTTSSGAGYDYSNGYPLPDVTGAGETHDITIKVATTTWPGPAAADEIYWGIAIPALQLPGIYTGSNTLTATSTIVYP